MRKSEFLELVAKMVEEATASRGVTHSDAAKIAEEHGFKVGDPTNDPVSTCVLGLWRFQTLRPEGLKVADHVRIQWMLEKAWEGHSGRV